MAAVEDLRALPSIAAEMAIGGITGLKNAIAKRLMIAAHRARAAQVARIACATTAA